MGLTNNDREPKMADNSRTKYTGDLFEKAFGCYGIVITDDILDAAFNDSGFVKEVGAEGIPF